MSHEPFNPETLHGLTLYDGGSKRIMRYIYPDADHWTAGWLLVRNPSGWMTLRKATDDDIARINAAVVKAHHGGH